MEMEWSSYEDFEKKYASQNNLDNFAKRQTLWLTYDNFGAMLRHGLVDAETLYDSWLFYSAVIWAKFEGIILEQRRRHSNADFLANFEYLSKEMMKIKLRRDPSYKNIWRPDQVQ